MTEHAAPSTIAVHQLGVCCISLAIPTSSTMEDAILHPLHLVRQLYASRSEDAGDDFGVAAAFGALVASPELGPKVGGAPCG